VALSNLTLSPLLKLAPVVAAILARGIMLASCSAARPSTTSLKLSNGWAGALPGINLAFAV